MSKRTQFVFYNIICFKILVGCLAGSYFLRDWFIPFVTYFVESGFQNPWEYFFHQGELKAFPYGSVMLYITALGKIVVSPCEWLFGGHIILNKLGFSLVFIASDVLIYKILCEWFQEQKQKVFYLYFCSPILLYAVYFHGQLDLIPVALLMLSLFFLLKKQYEASALVLGLATNAKFNIVITLPFILIFLWKRRLYKKAGFFLLLSLTGYILPLFPFALSEGYQQMVFQATEQQWVFDLLIRYEGQSFFLLIMPIFLGLLFLNYASYGRISRETLMMFIGLVFMMLVTLVKPMPGWYIWSYPFIVYAFLAYNDFPRFPVMVLSLTYYAYFIFNSSSTALDSFSLFNPAFQHRSTLEGWAKPYSEGLMDSILFVPLVSNMLYLMFIMFFLGLKTNNLVNFRRQPYLIGIGGDSGSGKHTLAALLIQMLGRKNTMQINGDADHKWERGHEKWQAYTHLNPKANQLYLQFDHTNRLKRGRSIQRVEYDHDTGKFTAPKKLEPGSCALFVGLHPYYIPQMRELFDLKIFMAPEESLRLKWKIERDMAKRGYSEQAILEQIQKRMDDSQKYIAPQEQFADLVIRYRTRKKGELEAEYRFSISWNVEGLLESLESFGNKDFQVSHSFEADSEKQTLVVSGIMQASVFRQCIEAHAELLEDYLDQECELADHINGFTQLLILWLFRQIRMERQ